SVPVTLELIFDADSPSFRIATLECSIHAESRLAESIGNRKIHRAKRKQIPVVTFFNAFACISLGSPCQSAVLHLVMKRYGHNTRNPLPWPGQKLWRRAGCRWPGPAGSNRRVFRIAGTQWCRQ